MGNKSYCSGAAVPHAGFARKWHESNCALARLVERHRRALRSAIVAAEAIDRGIDEIKPVMTALCRRTCAFCPDPCCVTHTVWFDFRDLLVFHLTGAPLPACQAASGLNQACPFLGRHGCSQPQGSRPWMCIQYLCPTQRVILEKRGQRVLDNLLLKIETLANQRASLEADVVCCIKKAFA